MYGKRLNSGGTDSQIFIAENLNISVRAYERAFISLDKNRRERSWNFCAEPR